MNAQESIAAFLRGETDIVTFRKRCDESPEIHEFLQAVIDGMRRTNAPTRYHWETRRDGVQVHSRSVVDDLLEREMQVYSEANPRPLYRTVQEALAEPGDVRCARHALAFYSRVYDLCLQYDPDMPYDPQYSDSYGFVLDVVPEYLESGLSEVYIREQVFPQFPETMKKGERKKAIKARIKELFICEKSRPSWVYAQSDWPLGKDGQPAVFVRQSTDVQHVTTFLFRDRTDGKEIVVTQARGW